MSDDLGFNLIAQLIHHLIGRPDKFDSGIFTLLCKIAVFRQESVTRMNGVHALCLRELYNLCDAQIDIHRSFAFSDLIGFISLCPEECVFILFGIDRHRADSQLAAGSENPDCDFASVCHEDFLKFFMLHPLSILSVMDLICFRSLSAASCRRSVL